MSKLIRISLIIVGIVILSSVSDGSSIWMFGSVLLALTHGTSTCSLLLVIALDKIIYKAAQALLWKDLPLKRIWVWFCFCCWSSGVLLITNDFRANWSVELSWVALVKSVSTSAGGPGLAYSLAGTGFSFYLFPLLLMVETTLLYHGTAGNIIYCWFLLTLTLTV